MGLGPAPLVVTTPGRVQSFGSPMASSTRGAMISPSPRTMQSIAPSACSRNSAATKEALWPPTNTKVSGRFAFVSLERSITSGTFAR